MKRLLSSLALLTAIPATVSAQAPAGTEFRVNAFTTGYQSRSSVAVDGSGNFVVVWASYAQDGSDQRILGRRFNASGIVQGSEFQVNSYTTSFQNFASVAADANGNFVVVWQSTGEDGSGPGIFGQRFNAAGVPQGSEFLVNSYTTNRQEWPRVASDTNGNFLVTWSDRGRDGSGAGVFVQRFDASGTRQGSEFQLNSFTTGDQEGVAVTADGSGNFVVVWFNEEAQDGDSFGIFGRRVDASGVPLGAEFQVNSYGTGFQISGGNAVAADPNGNFVVVWRGPGHGGDSSYDAVFGRLFNASGVPQGSEFLINTYTSGFQAGPSVAMDEHGNFVVVWASQDGSYQGVFGQRFNRSGVPQGGEFQINSSTTGVQYPRGVASSPDGDFVVVWRSPGQDGDGDDVFAQRYGDIIFEDGFDSGDLTRWSSATTDGGDLSANGAAALAGTSTGLQAVVNDTNSLFVQDDTPNAESRYRVRFYVDTNGFDPGEASSHFRTRLFIANSSAFRLVTIVLKRQLGAYSIDARVRRNDGTRADTGFLPISDGPHFIEFDWQRATGPGASDGSLQMWIDGGSVVTLSGIDNDLVPVDFIRMGALSVKTGAGGTLFYDQFESRRLRLIGSE